MHHDAANDRGHANQSIRSDLLSIHKHFNQTITEEILWFPDQTRGWLKENNIFDNDFQQLFKQIPNIFWFQLLRSKYLQFFSEYLLVSG